MYVNNIYSILIIWQMIVMLYMCIIVNVTKTVTG